jgi:hypothetical protein
LSMSLSGLSSGPATRVATGRRSRMSAPETPDAPWRRGS